MVGREGLEAAIMIASLATQSDMQHMLTGGILGIICAGIVALAWVRYGRKVNLARFLQVTAIFMVLFSIQLVIYAFHEFSEAGALPGLDNAYWHIATEPYGPEGDFGQWLSYGLILIPGAFLAATWFTDRFARLTPQR
jgi:high-affinity iron transporter